MYINKLTSVNNNNNTTNTVKGEDTLINVTVNEHVESTQAQNVTFNDANPAWHQIVHNDLDATFGNLDNSDAPLSDFLSRPVRIRGFDWVPGTTFFTTFNPWSDFLSNTRVINRINNFNLLRCNLHVRFLINGSPFHYGKILAGYSPRASVAVDEGEDQFEEVTSYDSDFNCVLSQRPHVFLDTTTSSGADIILPYIAPFNYMSIPDTDWYRMGTFVMQSLSTLKHANGEADRVSITVFAWAENVSLAIPTTVPSGDLFAQQTGEEFDAQMGLISKLKDEYGSGFISKPAAAISRMAGKMTNMPLIAPYARASEIGAGALSNVAGLLGFSRPTTSRFGYNVQDRPGGNYANTNVPDTSEKLTMDWKQEVTVDPRVVGLGGNDDLMISSIVAHESYMDQVVWPQSSTSEALLWNTFVTPCVGVGTGSAMYLTAPAVAAMPFSYWRGTIRYRFVIEASAYHRGRLKIVYDPNVTLSAADYNTQYTHVVDLQSERDFTIDVGWGSKYSYKNCENAFNRYPFQTSPNPFFSQEDEQFKNGVLAVYIVNALTGPSDSIDNDVTINVFMSMGEDAEFFGPTSQVLSSTSYFAQSGSESEEIFDTQIGEEAAEMTEEPSKPSPQSTEMSLAPHLLNDEHAVAVYYGDPIKSFRSLLKRYNYHSSIRWDIGSPPGSTLVRNSYRHWYFPFYRGNNVQAVSSARIDQTNGPEGTNYACTTLLNFLTPCYVAMRGGVRWKAVLISRSIVGSLQTYTRTGGFGDDGGGERNGYVISTDTQASATLADVAREDEDYYRFSNLVSGGTIIPHAQNPVVEAEIPFHNKRRFYNARHALAKFVKDDASNFADYRLEHVGNNGYAKTQFYCAAADDFGLYMFRGAPKIYSYFPAGP